MQLSANPAEFIFMQSLAFADDTVFVPLLDLPMTYTATAEEGFDLAATRGVMVALDAGDGSRAGRQRPHPSSAPGPRWPMTSSLELV